MSTTIWTDKEGAPAGATTIVPGADGYLYLGHSSGLFRFDGLQFDRVASPDGSAVLSQEIYSLFVAADGGLWIGFQLGGAARIQDGRIVVYGEADGLPAGSVKSFAQDDGGTMWAGTTSGLAKLTGSRWTPVDAKHGYPGTNTSRLFFDSAGTLWASSRGLLYALRRGASAFTALEGTFDAEAGIAESPTGAVWVVAGDQLHLVEQNATRPRGATSTALMLFDRDGALWTTAPSGLYRIAHPERFALHASVNVREIGDALHAPEENVAQDREGNVWTTTGLGLQRFSEGNLVQVLPSPQAGPVDFDAAGLGLAGGAGGTIWLLNRRVDQGLFRLNGSEVVGRAGPGPISAASVARDGSTWFGGRTALWHDTAGALQSVPMPDDADGFEVQALADDAAGDLWMSVVRRGVYRRAAGVWTRRGGIDALPKESAITLATDARGRVWSGYTNDRVAVVDGDAATIFSGDRGLEIGNVTALFAQGAHIWAGGNLGVAALRGDRFAALKPVNDEAFHNVTGIVETPAGDLWINGAAGVVRVDASDVARGLADPDYRVPTDVFDALRGLRGSSGRLRPLPTMIEGSDGRLWVSTSAGVFTLDPSRRSHNALPPPVVIKSIEVDGKSLTPVDGLALPKHTTALRIGYAALSLTLPERNRYRYRLDGVDAVWQDPGARREAYYTNLGPGPYTFRVIASNNDGVWNDTGATVRFSIRPAFVETIWFAALCVAAGLVMAWLVIRARIRQVSGRVRARLEERLNERERIARDLHDTLLQGTQGLILKFQAVANGMAVEDPDRAMLEKTLKLADRVMIEGRDRVMDLRVPTDALADLPQALAAAGNDLAEVHSTAFDVVVEGTPRALDRSVQDALYQIGREALINAFRHAEARAIDVQIVFADEALGLRIRDDGRGIDQDTLAAGARPGHWGLKGMTERAREVGGHLSIWSGPGKGTEIEATIPAARAFRAPVRVRWFRSWLTARSIG